MQEIDQVMHAAASCQQPCVMALVVDTLGSTYRRAGAIMLVREDGTMAGAVSGGCIEKEVVRRSRSVFATGRSLLIEYDGRYTLGCNGTLVILIEKFDPPERKMLFDRYQSTFQSRKAWSVIAGYKDDAIGMAFVFEQNHLLLTSSSGDSLSQQSRLQAIAQANSHSDDKTVLSNKTAGEFHMRVRPSRRLCIIGSEMDAIKLAVLAREVGYLTDIVTHPRNPDVKHDQADLNIAVVAPENLTQQTDIDEQSAVILMTHSYSRDLAYLKSLLAVPGITYLGMVGPKQRSNDLISELLEITGDLPGWFDQALRAPAGLDIGGEIPAEVALAILAEIQMVFAGHAGGELCKKSGGIHSPCESVADQPQLQCVNPTG